MESATTTAAARKYQRVPTELGVFVLEASRALSGCIRNLSVQGVFVELDGEAPERGVPVTLTFALDGPTAIRAAGVVRWRRARSADLVAGIGVELTDLRPDQTRALERYVERQRAGASCTIEPAFCVRRSEPLGCLMLQIRGTPDTLSPDLDRMLREQLQQRGGGDVLVDATAYRLGTLEDSQGRLVRLLKVLGEQDLRYAVLVLPDGPLEAMQLRRIVKLAGLADRIVMMASLDSGLAFLEGARRRATGT